MEANVTEAQYYTSLSTLRSKMCILYKRYANECHISPYNTVILATLRANMNIQFITDIYGVLAYLTSYMCKPEHTMSELMKKMCKENTGGSIKQKLKSIGNVFLTNREVPLHESIHRNLSMPLTRSNVTVKFVPTGPQENRSRTVYSNPVLDRIMQEDPNTEDIFTTGLLERYANRPDSLENNCFAHFASNYKVKSDKNPNPVDDDSLEGQFRPTPGYEEVPESEELIILKNEYGQMRKRSIPCVIRWHSIPKDKNPELYHLRLLQLYLHWRCEYELITQRWHIHF